MSKPAHPFNVILSAAQMDQLGQLARKRECSQAQVIRFALTSAYQMIFRHTPTCADGSRCYVPHMHSDIPKDPRPSLDKIVPNLLP